MTHRVVLDTNVVVSALILRGGRLSWIRHAWSRGDLLPLVSRATSRELIRVLAYPKFGLATEEVEALLGDYLPFTEAVPVEPGADVPEPPDPDDRMFLQLAVAGGARWLVTGDRALRAARPPRDVAILTPEELRAALEEE